MAKMNNKTRQNIVDICIKQGFFVKLKSSGEDEYHKNLMFRSGLYASNVYIHRDTGMDNSGNISYLKVAVHPELYKTEAVNISDGVNELLNNKTKINLHSSSNYKDFPSYSGNIEPCGKCYKAASVEALARLLSSLSSR